MASEPGHLLYFSLLLLTGKFSPYWHCEITTHAPPTPPPSCVRVPRLSFITAHFPNEFSLSLGSRLPLTISWRGSACPGLSAFLALLPHLPGQDTQSSALPSSVCKPALSNMVVSGHVWLFRVKQNYN